MSIESPKNESQGKGAEKLDSLLECIMPAEHYAQMRHKVPYIFELKSGDKKLYYFGAQHTRNPQDPLLGKIETAFDAAKPQEVFVEGINVRGDKMLFQNKVRSASRNEIVDVMGESGFTLKLAVEKGIEWRCPEPSDADVFENLLQQGFSKDAIFTWDVLQLLPQYHLQAYRDGFKKYTEKSITHFEQATNWENFDYSYEHAIELAQQILGRPLDVESESESIDFVDPIPRTQKRQTQTILNRISAASGLTRDKKIVSDILDAFKDHDRIFVVYGASHAVMQEPAFKKAFEVPAPAFACFAPPCQCADGLTSMEKVVKFDPERS